MSTSITKNSNNINANPVRLDPRKLAFDIDGVVADIMTTFIRMAQDEHQLPHLNYDDITDFNLVRCLGIGEHIIEEILQGLLERPHELAIEPLPHAVCVLTMLAQEHPLLFVTARDKPEPIRTWLRQTLEAVPAQAIRVIATGDPDTKLEYLQSHGIEYFVEDRLETCVQLARHHITPIVYDQPWNRGRHSFPLIYNWQDLARMIF
jgi:hypothetical protein